MRPPALGTWNESRSDRGTRAASESRARKIFLRTRPAEGASLGPVEAESRDPFAAQSPPTRLPRGTLDAADHPNKAWLLRAPCPLQSTLGSRSIAGCLGSKLENLVLSDGRGHTQWRPDR